MVLFLGIYRGHSAIYLLWRLDGFLWRKGLFHEPIRFLVQSQSRSVLFLMHTPEFAIEVTLFEMGQMEGLFLFLSGCLMGKVLLGLPLGQGWFGLSQLLGGGACKGLVGMGVDEGFLFTLEEVLRAQFGDSLSAAYETVQEG
jgi:hypothetical protein